MHFKILFQELDLELIRSFYSVWMHTGPSHMGLAMSPRESINLSDWSFTSGPVQTGVDWKGRPTYFCYLSQAEDTGSWDIWVELQVPADHRPSEPVLDLAFHTHHMQHSDHRQPDFLRFISDLPDWIHATTWSSSADFYVF